MRVIVIKNFRTDVAGAGPAAFKKGQRVDVAALGGGHRPEKWVENGLARWPWWWAALGCIVLADGAGIS